MSNILTWYGHATLGLETGGFKLLIDPFFSGNPAATVKPEEVSADYILVTHGHGDHVGDTVAIAKRTGATAISNAEISGWLGKQGVKETHAQHIGGGFKYPFGYLKLTMALHGSALPDGSNGGNPAGFLLTTNDGKKIYIAGDTGLFGDMKLIGEEGLDVAVIPIGDNYTMGPDGRSARCEDARAENGYPHPLQHLGCHPAGCRRLGGAGGEGDQREGSFVEAGGEFTLRSFTF